jgi:hypothetical protein
MSKYWEYKSGTGWCIWRWTFVDTGYITRLHLIKTPWFAVCLHWLNHPDPEPYLHDHPVTFLSVILRGWYEECRHLPELYVQNLAPWWVIRRWFNFIRATDCHTITILKHKANINGYGSFSKPGDVRNNISTTESLVVLRPTVASAGSERGAAVGCGERQGRGMDKYDDSNEIADHAAEVAANLERVIERDCDRASSNACARGLGIATFVGKFALSICGGSQAEALKWLEWFADEVRTQIGEPPRNHH